MFVVCLLPGTGTEGHRAVLGRRRPVGGGRAALPKGDGDGERAESGRVEGDARVLPDSAADGTLRSRFSRRWASARPRTDGADGTSQRGVGGLRGELGGAGCSAGQGDPLGGALQVP